MAATVTFDQSTGKYIGIVNGQVVVRTRFEEFAKKQVIVKSRSVVDANDIIASDPVPGNTKFSINTRFNFIEKLVTMIANGVQDSAVLTGAGGLGKTYTVTKTLQHHGYKDLSDLSVVQEGEVIDTKSYISIKGYSTAKGLYRSLFDNNGRVIIFDDCDEVLRDRNAILILKGALDSYGKRMVSWNAEMEDLPRSFNFTGRIIFISNMHPNKIDQAIRSRSMMIDLSMTDDQKIDRMEYIAKSDEFMPDHSINHKLDALNLIRQIKTECKDISLRTLISVTKIRANNHDWKDLAHYIICN